MAGHKNWRTLLKNTSPGRLAKIKADADRQLAEIALNDLRKTQNVTQTELASRLGISQAALSQRENQQDMQISTLRKIIEAMGGELDISVRMPNAIYRLSGMK